MTKDPSQFWLIREELDRAIECAQHLSRCAWIVACDVVVKGVEVGQGGARQFYSARHQLRARRARAATLRLPRRITFSISSSSAGPESRPFWISDCNQASCSLRRF